MAWEAKLNAFGHAVQGFGYTCALGEASSSTMALTAWGAFEPDFVPLVERLAVRLLYPFLQIGMMATFRLFSQDIKGSYRHTLALVLDDADAALAKSPHLAGNELTYVDIAFASLLAPLMVTTVCLADPSKYANGRFGSFSRVLRGNRVAPPKLMLEFEQELLSRPCGQYALNLCETRRGNRGCFSDPAATPSRGIRESGTDDE